MTERFRALTAFFENANEADFERLKAGVLKRTEPVALPPGWSVETVARLQDDKALVEKAALLASGLDADEKDWPEDLDDFHKSTYRMRAKAVLAMVDELRGQRVFKIEMPGTGDDSMVLRELFGHNDA